jgi:DNA ligase-like, N-terminal NAD+-binding domain
MGIVIKKKAAAAAPAPDPVVPRAEPKSPAKVLDSMCLCVLRKTPNSAIPWWLMASYLYYQHDTPLLPDGLYDEMAKAMLEAWDDLHHPHKHLIGRAALEAGSLHNLAADAYPSIVKHAAANLARHELGVEIAVQ